MWYCISALVIYRLLPMILLSGLVGGSTPEPKTTAPQKIKIEMTGHDFKWASRYAGNDEKMDTFLEYPMYIFYDLTFAQRVLLTSVGISEKNRWHLQKP